MKTYLQQIFILIGLAILVILVAFALPQNTIRTGHIEDGTHFGFIRSSPEDIHGIYAEFDPAFWLIGAEGERAAIAAGHCTEETKIDCLPTGFFIENTSTSTVMLRIDPGATIQMDTYKTSMQRDSPEIVTIREFKGLIQNSSLIWRYIPYHLTVQNGEITRIEEQYVP